LTQLTGLGTTVVVAGARDELLQKCCDALETAPRFSVVNVSEDQFQVEAKYWRPPVWGKLVVTLLPEGTDSTRISARITSTRPLYAWTGPDLHQNPEVIAFGSVVSHPDSAIRILRAWARVDAAWPAFVRVRE
jgi:hypothetical protein